jgi:hypothetical protein
MPDNLSTKIALSMIVRGDKDDHIKMERALSSIAPYVDGIYVTITGPRNLVKKTEDVLKKYNANVSYYDSLWTATEEAIKFLTDYFGYEPKMKVGDKIFVFDKARNYSMDQIPKEEYDWLLWMDSDDVFKGGEKLHELAKIGIQQNIEAFYFNYLYQAEFDEEGNIKHRIIEHLRERLLRHTGVFKWIAPIHETLIEQRPTRKTDNYDCEVIHLSTAEDKINSLNRNLKNLELSIYQTEGKDPRPVYYLAKAYFDLRTNETDDRAIPLIMHYLLGEDKSGWPEERAQAWEYLAEIYRRKNQHNNAIKAALNAFTEPTEPTMTPFLNLAVSFMLKEQYDLALFWVRLATKIPEKKTTLVKNVKDVQARTLEVIFNSCLNLSKIDEAHAAALKLKELYPDDENINNSLNFVNNLKAERDISMKVTELANFLKQTGEREKIKSLLNSVPQIASDNPFIAKLYQENNPPKAWEENEISIYCGPGFTNWSPKQLDKPGGSFVGGSEEAVINLSRELTKIGWKITVYGDPGVDEGEYEGVTYLPYYKFNKLDNFNILISWRQLGFFDQELSANKKYLWLHDIPNRLEFTPERFSKIDKIIVLSKWQRDLIDHVSDDKIFISTNGI